jgi:hypothetical protein
MAVLADIVPKETEARVAAGPAVAEIVVVEMALAHNTAEEPSVAHNKADFEAFVDKQASAADKQAVEVSDPLAALEWALVESAQT